MQEWALALTPNCDTASLTLSKLPAILQCTWASGLAENPDTLVKMRFEVLTSAGHSLRHLTVPVRYGNGPITIGLDLTGGAALQISYQGATQAMVVVYAMTAS